MSAHYPISLCISGPVKSVQKKNYRKKKNSGIPTIMYLFQCKFVSQAVKMLIQLEFLHRNEGFSLNQYRLYSLLSSQFVMSEAFYLVLCWIFKFCVSVGAAAGAAVLGTVWSRHPVLAPLWRERGLAGLFKSLLHRDRHFWFYPWCYVQEWRPTSDA